MSQQRSFSMSDWNPADSGYRIERRTKKMRGTGQLSGYALDLTIRVNHQEAYFLQDHNGTTRPAFPFNNREELIEMIVKELERNHAEHFGQL
jgi:hypothetical protein